MWINGLGVKQSPMVGNDVQCFGTKNSPVKLLEGCEDKAKNFVPEKLNEMINNQCGLNQFRQTGGAEFLENLIKEKQNAAQKNVPGKFQLKVHDIIKCFYEKLSELSYCLCIAKKSIDFVCKYILKAADSEAVKHELDGLAKLSGLFSSNERDCLAKLSKLLGKIHSCIKGAIAPVGVAMAGEKCLLDVAVIEALFMYSNNHDGIVSACIFLSGEFDEILNNVAKKIDKLADRVEFELNKSDIKNSAFYIINAKNMIMNIICEYVSCAGEIVEVYKNEKIDSKEKKMVLNINLVACKINKLRKENLMLNEDSPIWL